MLLPGLRIILMFFNYTFNTFNVKTKNKIYQDDIRKRKFKGFIRNILIAIKTN